MTIVATRAARRVGFTRESQAKLGTVGARRKLTFDELKADLRLSPTVPAKVLAHVSPKLSIQGIRLEQLELEQVAKLATRADAARKRKALAFPPLRSYYAKARVNVETGEVIRKARSYYLEIWDYCQRWAFRTMQDLQRRGLPLPDHEQFEDLFRTRILERAAVLDLLEKGRPGLTPDTVEHLAEQAASAALRDFDPLYNEKQSERGKLARGKPKPSRRKASLEALDLLDGMTATEQAATLGVSRAAIYRMYKAKRERDAASAAEER